MEIREELEKLGETLKQEREKINRKLHQCLIERQERDERCRGEMEKTQR